MTTEKKITPTDLKSKLIEPRYGQHFKPFEVFEVYGNDSIKYETLDANYFKTFVIGREETVQYNIEKKVKNGREFISYKISPPGPKNNQDIIIEKLDELLGLVRGIVKVGFNMKSADEKEKEAKGFVYPKEELKPNFDIQYPDDDDKKPSPNY